MGKLAVVDTCDVLFKEKKTGKVFLTFEAQLSSISQSLGINESIFGGIGSKKIFQFKGQKEITTTVRNGLYDIDFLSLTQGVDVVDDETVTVHKTEDSLVVTDNAGTLEVTLTGTPSGTTAYVRNEQGETEEAAISTQVVTIPTGHAEAGDIVSVTYETSATGKVLQLLADKFGKSFEVEYRTIGYDVVTNEVSTDIYIKLGNVIPNGEFELALENGTAVAPEFTFDALVVPNTNTFGEIIEIPRV